MDVVDNETKEVSSQILDLIAVEGEVSQPGPGVASCDDRDREKFFKLRHPWSVTASSNKELEEAMGRLKEQLPKQGWDITEYGRNNSKNRSLELTADHHEKKFGVNVVLMANHGGDESPLLAVTVVSACYQVPKGERVEHY
ncbi:hypothetical protein N566_26130 [Streptomycetaceae bacterium MP113-05]|nr:hypothetical protein N566_26130 [Streptomycetaceae bacterium MP113-05]